MKNIFEKKNPNLTESVEIVSMIDIDEKTTGTVHIHGDKNIHPSLFSRLTKVAKVTPRV